MSENQEVRERSEVTDVRAELRSDTDSVGVASPRLSWKTRTPRRNWEQASAEIEIDELHTIRREGGEQVLVDWPFEPLSPRARHTVRVRVTGTDGDLSDWSAPLSVVAGFLAPGEWHAEPIGLPAPERLAQPALLRTTFEVSKPLARATLYATARGAYQVLVNGREVDDEVLKPGWTPYAERVVHEFTDITSLLTDGHNAVGVTLAGAWFTERFGFSEASVPFYGEQPDAALQIILDFQDGETQVVKTGSHWRAFGGGPLTHSSLYDGERYDARLEQPGWADASFDDSEWDQAEVASLALPTPEPRISPAVRVMDELPVIKVIESSTGGRILDFGQNLVGRVRVHVRGEAGTEVTIRHAEVLEDGELGVRPLRLAKATDAYILRGGEEVLEPRFTFHGFRYAEVSGLSEQIDHESVTAIVLHTDMKRTGWFECSDPLLDKLHENVVWGMRGNFLSVPTDCPQRDERLGWTGDIQVFAPTASFLYDVDAFLSSWLVDLAIEQRGTLVGSVPFVVPNVLADAMAPVAAWGDAATVVPSVIYERFGDVGVLGHQYESMKAWADHLIGIAGDSRLWKGGFQFGDWLDPTAPPDNPFLARTDPDLVATAYLFRSVQLVARAARDLDRPGDFAAYDAEAGRIHGAFIREFVAPSGRIVSDSQTAYALAIKFGLFASTQQRDAMGVRLAELVRSGGYRIGTGFVGTPIITDALEVTQQDEALERLLMQTECPSWLYPVTMGATTVWERWDSMLEDGSINPGEMTSFNHYALGAVADWLHRSVAGLASQEPGYRVIRVAPRPLDALTQARASLDSPYGRVEVGWRRSGDEIIVSAVVPANARAEVVLPDRDDIEFVGSGAHEWRIASVRKRSEFPVVGRTTFLSQIIRDPEAYRAIGSAIEAVDPARAQRWRRNTNWTPGVTLEFSLGPVPLDVSTAIDSALDDINVRRKRAHRQ